MNLKMERFNPKTFKPFDKVLVRDEANGCWAPYPLCVFAPDVSIPILCFNLCWQQCIPYNEETKHLLGTAEDCPEYYKWWEE